LFFIQNKNAGRNIHGYQTAVTAQYKFDWHRSLCFRSALKYASK